MQTHRADSGKPRGAEASVCDGSAVDAVVVGGRSQARCREEFPVRAYPATAGADGCATGAAANTADQQRLNQTGAP
jgi:hypothetical protein